MAIWIAVLLGVVQGVFMFLPVSSTAHLVLTQHWLIGQGYDLPAPESAEMVLFDLVVHVGTLVSIAVVFWPSLSKVTTGVVRDGYQWAASQGGGRELLFLRLALLCALSVFVTAIIGLTLKVGFMHFFASPLMVAGTLTITGLLLWFTDGLSRRPIGLRKISPRIAVIIGFAQGLALIPGLSRSGMTITFALFAGLKRRWAAEYSFFLAIPTILAATAVQAIDVYRLGGLQGLDYTVLLVGFVVAALVGILALRLVLFFLYRARLKVFSFYLWVLAAVVAFGYLDPAVI
ncbi:undecaprenyl-diphosphate phosphatase [Marinimicrobium sp. ABcell2]|uniref:undecaprenyl-diphosphate phosphatase n=1 Tax=Marinimicrobium sp. ABcell2 TaxID=3069751 RepID=UPI0027AE0968|nr:undecaprenyl-diphosphate phosphatase [Marinimicrobium sp. ABcell2]MDQ2076866.1 undecaprenyl-diphosphate phosphatase [Marinimicrobium sp. ABcell2]